MKSAVLVLISSAAIALAAPAPAPSPTGIPSSTSAKSLLAKLSVGSGDEIDGYERDKFKTWIQQGDNCDTREYVLKRDGTGVKVDNACESTSGTWTSPYDDKKWTSASDLQIDHMVPLKNAWDSGAANWTASRREDYANDITRPQLWAVTSSVNESKGERSPDEWKPPSDDFFCTYAEAWVEVKSYYGLTITDAEKSALSDMLDTC